MVELDNLVEMLEDSSLEVTITIDSSGFIADIEDEDSEFYLSETYKTSDELMEGLEAMIKKALKEKKANIDEDVN